MVSWNDVRQELEQTRLPNGQIDFDTVRRRKICEVAEYTSRPLIVYAADFLNQTKVQASGGEVNIDYRDKEGFLEVTKNIRASEVDVLIHSPGGMPEAAESIVNLLRTRFRHIRFIVPNIAKSAATMLVLSGNEIVMDENSELGPIDPQFMFQRADGSTIVAPAQAIIDQFDEAEKKLSKEPKLLPAWIPILPLYGPALYQQSKTAIKLSKKLVQTWLKEYMFADLPSSPARIGAARRIANFLGSHKNFLTHARRVGLAEIRKIGARVIDMNDDLQLREKVHALYLTISLTFDNTSAFKIFENSGGDAYIRMVQVQQISIARPSPPAQTPSQESPVQQSQT